MCACPTHPLRAIGSLFLALAAATPGLLAQDDEARLRTDLLRAFRGVDDPVAQGFADLDAVFVDLESLASRVTVLPAGKRERTRFFIDVRATEVRLRQRKLEEAGRLGLATRTRAITDGVFAGSYRTQLIVLLEQSLDAATFRRILAEEREFVASDEALAEAPWLALPLALLRAQIAFDSGDDAGGLRRLEQSAESALRDLPRDDPWRVKCVGRLAWEFVVRRDLARADVYLKELPQQMSTYPRGLVALRRGDHDFALRAGQALERSGQLVAGLMLQGEAEEGAGDHPAARSTWTRLLEHAKEPLDRAIALRSLGDCILAGDADPAALTVAEQRYREALTLLGGDRHAAAERVQVHAQLGATLARLGRADEARTAYRASLRELDAARAGVATDLFGGSWLAKTHLRAIEGLLGLWDDTAGDAAEALAILELGKARTLLDWATSPPQVGADAGMADAVRNLVLSDDPRALDAQLRALEDARRRSDDGSDSAAVPLPADVLRQTARAAPTTLFLSYWIGEHRAYVVAAMGESGSVVDLGAADAVRRTFARAVEAITNDDEPWPALDAAAAVFLPSTIRDLHARAERIVICPDDELGRLPFEALRVDGRSLGRSHRLERAPSLSVRAQLAARKAMGSQLAIVDSVTAPADETRLGLAPLTFSAREADLVAQAYRVAPHRLSAAAATRAALRDLLDSGGYDVVHVSAHAVENPLLPTASLLLLADGPVALPSLVDVPLRGALLVLSACSSANGVTARGGEGELGLLGWPIAAGARGLIASIWPVNQQATADLMGQFHAFLASGSDVAEAMRRARDVLAAAPQYTHPRYWAGFVVIGSDAATAERPVTPWVFALFAAIVAAAFLLLRRRRAMAA